MVDRSTRSLRDLLGHGSGAKVPRTVGFVSFWDRKVGDCGVAYIGKATTHMQVLPPLA